MRTFSCRLFKFGNALTATDELPLWDLIDWQDKPWRRTWAAREGSEGFYHISRAWQRATRSRSDATPLFKPVDAVQNVHWWNTGMSVWYGVPKQCFECTVMEKDWAINILIILEPMSWESEQLQASLFCSWIIRQYRTSMTSLQTAFVIKCHPKLSAVVYWPSNQCDDRSSLTKWPLTTGRQFKVVASSWGIHRSSPCLQTKACLSVCMEGIAEHGTVRLSRSYTSKMGPLPFAVVGISYMTTFNAVGDDPGQNASGQNLTQSNFVWCGTDQYLLSFWKVRQRLA